MKIDTQGETVAECISVARDAISLWGICQQDMGRATAKNGAKFQKLFYDWDISDYGSESEADAALASLIAFWVGNDPETIMQLIEQSSLYDDKWKRADYQKATIAAGIRACKGVFHKDVMPKKRPPFVC